MELKNLGCAEAGLEALLHLGLWQIDFCLGLQGLTLLTSPGPIQVEAVGLVVVVGSVSFVWNFLFFLVVL